MLLVYATNKALGGASITTGARRHTEMTSYSLFDSIPRTIRQVS
jgi:hypothetical protein